MRCLFFIHTWCTPRGMLLTLYTPWMRGMLNLSENEKGRLVYSSNWSQCFFPHLKPFHLRSKNDFLILPVIHFQPIILALEIWCQNWANSLGWFFLFSLHSCLTLYWYASCFVGVPVAWAADVWAERQPPCTWRGLAKTSPTTRKTWRFRCFALFSATSPTALRHQQGNVLHLILSVASDSNPRVHSFCVYKRIDQIQTFLCWKKLTQGQFSSIPNWLIF